MPSFIGQVFIAPTSGLVRSPGLADNAVTAVVIMIDTAMTFENAMPARVSARIHANAAGARRHALIAVRRRPPKPEADWRIHSLIFTQGIIDTGLLAIRVLAGSAAYALADGRRWPVGLARQPREAWAFYLSLVVATLISVDLYFVTVR